MAEMTLSSINLIIDNESITVVVRGPMGARTYHDATPPGLQGKGYYHVIQDDQFITVTKAHPDYPHSRHRATIASVLADAPVWEALPLLVEHPPRPSGAVGWVLANGRKVYPVDSGYVAADDGGWLTGVRGTVDAWATDADMTKAPAQPEG